MLGRKKSVTIASTSAGKGMELCSPILLIRNAGREGISNSAALTEEFMVITCCDRVRSSLGVFQMVEKRSYRETLLQALLSPHMPASNRLGQPAICVDQRPMQ